MAAACGGHRRHGRLRAVSFDTPITGGNVSLYNETLGERHLPHARDGHCRAAQDRRAGDHSVQEPRRAVVLLGGIGGCDETRFGGTGYAKEILKQLWGLPPALDLEREMRVAVGHPRNCAAGLAESAHDLSDGGLAVALAECSLGPAGIGAAIDIDSDLRPEMLAFHEAPSRILISTAHPGKVAAIAERHGIEAPVVGVYNRDRDGNPAARHDTGFLGNRNAADAYEGALESYVR